VTQKVAGLRSITRFTEKELSDFFKNDPSEHEPMMKEFVVVDPCVPCKELRLLV